MCKHWRLERGRFLQGGVDRQHEDRQHGQTGTLRHGAPDPLTVEGQRTNIGTGSGMGAGVGAGTSTDTLCTCTEISRGRPAAAVHCAHVLPKILCLSRDACSILRYFAIDWVCMGAGGPAPGTTISAKDLASDATKREWAAAENAPLAGDSVSDARQPVPSTASTAGGRS